MSTNTNLRDYAIDKLHSGTSAHETSRVFNYQGSEITFQNDKDVMVNATEMAKAFGKRPLDWLRTKQSKDYTKALSEVRKCTPSDLVIVRYGDNGGTWLHQDVALEFARWLSPAFAIWTNDRIKELLTTGVATINNDDETIANAMLILQKRLDSQKQRLQIAEGERDHYQAEVRILAPKAEYTDEVLQSTSTFTFTQISKTFGLRSVHVLTAFLKEKGIIYRQSGQWMPTSRYSDKGYFKTRTARYFHKDGTPDTSLSTVITEYGRVFLWSLLSKHGRLNAVNPKFETRGGEI